MKDQENTQVTVQAHTNDVENASILSWIDALKISWHAITHKDFCWSRMRSTKTAFHLEAFFSFAAHRLCVGQRCGKLSLERLFWTPSWLDVSLEQVILEWQSASAKMLNIPATVFFQQFFRKCLTGVYLVVVKKLVVSRLLAGMIIGRWINLGRKSKLQQHTPSVAILNCKSH